jgi:hypothetical protein
MLSHVFRSVVASNTPHFSEYTSGERRTDIDTTAFVGVVISFDDVGFFAVVVFVVVVFGASLSPHGHVTGSLSGTWHGGHGPGSAV